MMIRAMTRVRREGEIRVLVVQFGGHSLDSPPQTGLDA